MELTARTRLEIYQIYKLIQLVHTNSFDEINKLIEDSVPNLINYREPDGGEAALHIAAYGDNIPMINYLMGLEANPDVQDFLGRTPVMRAAEQGHHKTVELFCKNKANLKKVDAEGVDVLAYCLASGTSKRHRRCMDICLSFGADPNVSNDAERPTLVRACEDSVELETLTLMLLEKGANPSVYEKENGLSALICACQSGSDLVLRALLKNGAEVDHRDSKQKTAFHHAALKGNMLAVMALSGFGADPTLVDEFGNSPLFYGSLGPLPQICTFLYQRGGDPTEKNFKGITPMQLCKERKIKPSMKILKKLEKAKKKESSSDYQDVCPVRMCRLYDWIYQNQTELLALFERRKIPNEILNSDSLMKGNFVWQSLVQETLTEMGAPFPEDDKKKFYQDHDYESKGILDMDELVLGRLYMTKPFMAAAYLPKKKKEKKPKIGKGKGGKLKITMPICVDVDETRREDGGPPKKFVEKQQLETDSNRFDRDLKPKHEYEDDSTWYLQKPESQFIAITAAARVGDMETIKEAFESGVPVDTRDKFYKTSLMVAAAEGNFELCEYLLNQGADPNVRDNFKWTALHHAAHCGQVDVVHLLLLSEADGNALTWNGGTPLMRAIMSGNIEVVRFLLDCGVNLTHFNKQEKQALDIAEDWAGAAIYNLVKEYKEKNTKPGKKGAAGKDKAGPPKAEPNKPLNIPPLVRKPKEEISDAESKAFFKNLAEQNLLDGKKLGGESRINTSQVPATSAAVSKSLWERTPSTEGLMQERRDKRERFGTDVDFDDFAMPLKSNIDRLIEYQQQQMGPPPPAK